MESLTLLDQLDDFLYTAKQIPLTEQVRVDRDEAYHLLDRLRAAIIEDVGQPGWEPEQPQEDTEEPRLAAIAESLAELKRAQRPAPPPLTAAAAEKVRAVIEAAEGSAAEVRADAEREARRIVAEAERRGAEIRAQSAAAAEARLKRADDVTRVLLDEAGTASARIEGLLERVRGPAAALADALEDGSGQVRADFDRMSAQLVGEPAAAEAEAPERPAAVRGDTVEFDPFAGEHGDPDDRGDPELPGAGDEVAASRLEQRADVADPVEDGAGAHRA